MRVFCQNVRIVTFVPAGNFKPHIIQTIHWASIKSSYLKYLANSCGYSQLPWHPSWPSSSSPLSARTSTLAIQIRAIFFRYRKFSSFTPHNRIYQDFEFQTVIFSWLVICHCLLFLVMCSLYISCHFVFSLCVWLCVHFYTFYFRDFSSV